MGLLTIYSLTSLMAIKKIPIKMDLKITSIFALQISVTSFFFLLGCPPRVTVVYTVCIKANDTTYSHVVMV